MDRIWYRDRHCAPTSSGRWSGSLVFAVICLLMALKPMAGQKVQAVPHSAPMPCGWEIAPGGIVPGKTDGAKPLPAQRMDPLLGLDSQALDSRALKPQTSNPQDRARPRRIAPASTAPPCLLEPGHPMVHCFDALSMVVRTRSSNESRIDGSNESSNEGSNGSRIELRVTALEDGWKGNVIRCRASLNGALLRGRVLDARTVELVPPEGAPSW